MSLCQLFFSGKARNMFISNHHPMTCMSMTSQMMIFSPLSMYDRNRFLSQSFLLAIYFIFRLFILDSCYLFVFVLFTMPETQNTLARFVIRLFYLIFFQLFCCYLFSVHIADI